MWVMEFQVLWSLLVVQTLRWLFIYFWFHELTFKIHPLYAFPPKIVRRKMF